MLMTRKMQVTSNISPVTLAVNTTHLLISVTTLHGCSGSTVVLSCPRLSTLRVVRANYGRFSISVCNTRARLDISTDCGAEDSTTEVLVTLCQGLNTCSVPVETNTFPWESPCPQTSKYLEVQFR